MQCEPRGVLFFWCWSVTQFAASSAKEYRCLKCPNRNQSSNPLRLPITGGGARSLGSKNSFFRMNVARQNRSTFFPRGLPIWADLLCRRESAFMIFAHTMQPCLARSACPAPADCRRPFSFARISSTIFLLKIQCRRCLSQRLETK